MILMFLSCQVSILSNSIKMRYYSKYCRDSSFKAYFNYFKNQRLSVQNVFSVKIRFDQNQFKFHTHLPSRTSTISRIKGCVFLSFCTECVFSKNIRFHQNQFKSQPKFDSFSQISHSAKTTRR